MKIIFYMLYYIIQFSWGLLQNLIGLAYFLLTPKNKQIFFNGALVGFHGQNWGGISLGIFIIINGTKTEQWEKNTLIHEYGHTIQSLLLGPLYLFVIGLPSFIWCNSKYFIKKRKEKNISYFSFYPEKWANQLGELTTKQKIIKTE